MCVHNKSTKLEIEMLSRWNQRPSTDDTIPTPIRRQVHKKNRTSQGFRYVCQQWISYRLGNTTLYHLSMDWTWCTSSIKLHEQLDINKARGITSVLVPKRQLPGKTVLGYHLKSPPGSWSGAQHHTTSACVSISGVEKIRSSYLMYNTA